MQATSVSKVIWLSILAALLFTLLFLDWGGCCSGFWVQMAGTNIILVLAAQFAEGTLLPRLAKDAVKQRGSKILLGLLSALLLYLLFFAGNALCRSMLPLAAASQISQVYALKTQLPAWQIALLLIFVIGPGEEIFWRGFVLHNFRAAHSPILSLAAASAIYAAVHIASGNWLLIMAAAICGLFWGGLYLWRGSLLLNIVSHIVWDVAVFLILPLQ
jgi:uncharacterized protein